MVTCQFLVVNNKKDSFSLNMFDRKVFSTNKKFVFLKNVSFLKKETDIYIIFKKTFSFI